MATMKMPCAVGTGESNVKTGTLEYSSSTTYYVETGLSSITNFVFLGRLIGNENTHSVICTYNKTSNGFRISGVADYNTTVAQTVCGSSYFSSAQNFAPVISNIDSNGKVTIIGGSNGSWGQFEGTWYAD